MWNAVFRVAFRFSREIKIGKPAPNIAPVMRKTIAMTITLVQARTILPTRAGLPGYHASSARSITTRVWMGDLDRTYIVTDNLSDSAAWGA